VTLFVNKCSSGPLSEGTLVKTAIFHRRVGNLCDTLTLLQQFLERGSLSIL